MLLELNVHNDQKVYNYRPKIQETILFTAIWFNNFKSSHSKQMVQLFYLLINCTGTLELDDIDNSYLNYKSCLSFHKRTSGRGLVQLGQVEYMFPNV